MRFELFEEAKSELSEYLEKKEEEKTEEEDIEEDIERVNKQNTRGFKSDNASKEKLKELSDRIDKVKDKKKEN